MRAAGMFVAFVMQTANQREVIGHPRQRGQQFVNLHPGDSSGNRAEGAFVFGGSGRLQVEQIDMAGSAIRPEEDDRELGIDLRLGFGGCE